LNKSKKTTVPLVLCAPPSPIVFKNEKS